MDSCFMGKVDEKAQPILVVKERGHENDVQYARGRERSRR